MQRNLCYRLVCVRERKVMNENFLRHLIEMFCISKQTSDKFLFRWFNLRLFVVVSKSIHCAHRRKQICLNPNKANVFSVVFGLRNFDIRCATGTEKNLSIQENQANQEREMKSLVLFLLRLFWNGQNYFKYGLEVIETNRKQLKLK